MATPHILPAFMARCRGLEQLQSLVIERCGTHHPGGRGHRHTHKRSSALTRVQVQMPRTNATQRVPCTVAYHRHDHYCIMIVSAMQSLCMHVLNVNVVCVCVCLTSPEERKFTLWRCTTVRRSIGARVPPVVPTRTTEVATAIASFSMVEAGCFARHKLGKRKFEPLTFVRERVLRVNGGSSM
jgi:hypothetical protein